MKLRLSNLLLLSGLVFFAKLAFSMGLSCQDPDTVLCLSLQEGSGTTLFNTAKSTGLQGTINGGPIWMTSDQAMRNWASANFTQSQTSVTHVLMPPHYLKFAGVGGEDVVTSSVTSLEFFGKNCMIAFILKADSLTGQASAIISYESTGIVQAVAKVWSIEHESDNSRLKLLMTYNGQGFYWNNNTTITDTRPHSYLFAKYTTGDLLLFKDGLLSTTVTGASDMVQEADVDATTLTIGRATPFAATEFSNSIGPIQIWKDAVPKHAAQSFAMAWHRQWFGPEEPQ